MCKVSTKQLAENNQHQIDEALGDNNRYFASRFYKKEITDESELVIYYITHGGAAAYRKRVSQMKFDLE